MSYATVLHFDPATETLPLIGSKEGLSHLALTVVNPGDVAIVPEPGYQAYLGGSLLARYVIEDRESGGSAVLMLWPNPLAPEKTTVRLHGPKARLPSSVRVATAGMARQRAVVVERDDIAGSYSLAWMDYHLRGDTAALDVLRSAHPHLSYLWDSEVQINGETTVMRGAGPVP